MDAYLRVRLLKLVGQKTADAGKRKSPVAIRFSFLQLRARERSM